MTREWKPGDRALLPVVVAEESVHARLCWITTPEGRNTRVNRSALLPDDRRPDWLPGQPGDVAEWGGLRRGRSADGKWWPYADMTWDPVTDDDVPADAVLVLKAKTREQS